MGLLVILTQVLKVGIAIELVHAVDQALGEASQLGAWQGRDYCEKG
ncbi:hypothetical protein KZ813_17790 [Sphingomonas sp. RHCKR7]|nr:hypothetical protein [Sphingomonas folli]MBW6528698.1 hypothetical protein [Sphingomonas folli]